MYITIQKFLFFLIFKKLILLFERNEYFYLAKTHLSDQKWL